MSSDWLMHEGMDEVIPYNAKFEFPSQATRTLKTTVKIQPKTSDAYFEAGRTIRFEFPANGYLNPMESYLEFEVFLNINQSVTGTDSANTVDTLKSTFARLNNNVASIFNRVRLLYGGTVIEDILDCGLLERLLTEVGVSKDYADGLGGMNGIGSVDQRASHLVSAGGCLDLNVGGAYTAGSNNALSSVYNPTIFSPIQGGSTVAGVAGSFGVPAAVSAQSNYVSVASNKPNPLSFARRYCMRIPLGLFQQRKLLPLKWMGSQLAIEFTIEKPIERFVIVQGPNDNISQGNSSYPVFGITDVNLINTVYEFEANYDKVFYEALKKSGVPIKFSSWHHTPASIASGSLNIPVQERSRSVKAAIAAITPSQASFTGDFHSTFSCFRPSLLPNISSTLTAAGFVDAGVAVTNNGTPKSRLLEYQWRIGSRYFPAQPVEVHTSTVTEGTAQTASASVSLTSAASVTGSAPAHCEGMEALLEAEKAFNVLGAYQTGCQFKANQWANLAQQTFPFITSDGDSGITNANLLRGNCDRRSDQRLGLASRGGNRLNANNAANFATLQAAVRDSVDPLQSGNNFFIMAADLETSNGLEMSGINCEEQSDIYLQMRFDTPQSSSYSSPTTGLHIYVNYDALLIIKENNVVNLIS